MSELLEFILQHEEAFSSNSRRLASLYADFSNQRSTNPDGYYANVSAWKKALADAARAGVIPGQGNTHDLLSIRTGEELARALQHSKFGRPTCLAPVFHDAVSKKEFLPLKDFLNSPTNIYKTSWIPSPWSVLQWGLKQIGIIGQPGFGDKLEVGNFVVLSNLEVAAAGILKRMTLQTSAIDRILSRTEFLKRFADILNTTTRLSQNDLNILLVHLARDKQAISYNEQTIKFKPDSEALPTPITQEDTAIANLRDTLTRMNAQIPPLEERIAETDTAVREAVRKKQHFQAKAALKSKKLAESALQQRTNVVLQLEEVYAQLQQAADQIEIVEAMKAGAAALKGLNEKVGGAEGVSAVVDVLREEMATADEITNIINESAQPVDEGEIDDELEALERAEKEKREQAEKAEKERREQEEAAKTVAKLAVLEQAERERKEQVEEREKAKASEEDAKEEEQVEQASHELSRLSFQEDLEAEGVEKEREKEKVPIPA